METSFFEILSKYAGIAGIVLGILLLVFQEIIRKNLYSKLGQDQSYKIIRLLIWLTWSTAIIGLGIWFSLEYNKKNAFSLKDKLNIPDKQVDNRQDSHKNEDVRHTSTRRNNSKPNDTNKNELVSFPKIKLTFIVESWQTNLPILANGDTIPLIDDKLLFKTIMIEPNKEYKFECGKCYKMLFITDSLAGEKISLHCQQ